MATYVCSDIHGQYDLWLKLLKKIQFNKNDTMYILGDVIDRGDKPITLLKDILSRPNCFLLLGNHEKMLLDTFTAKTMQKQNHNLVLWSSNGAETTLKEFRELTDIERKDIVSQLINLPIINVGLTVDRHFKDGRVVPYKYYLAHSKWSDMYLPDGIYQYDSIPDNEDVIWNRDFCKYYETPSDFLLSIYKDYVFISGHTPTPNIKYKYIPHCRNNNIPKGSGRIFHSSGHFIDVDCGSYGNGIITLGCIRLDDWTEFYVQKG